MTATTSRNEETLHETDRCSMCGLLPDFCPCDRRDLFTLTATKPDYTRLTDPQEITEITGKRDELRDAADALDALLQEGSTPQTRAALRPFMNLLGDFIPGHLHGFRGLLDRLTENRCPDCFGTPDVCDCRETDDRA